MVGYGSCCTDFCCTCCDLKHTISVLVAKTILYCNAQCVTVSKHGLIHGTFGEDFKAHVHCIDAPVCQIIVSSVMKSGLLRLTVMTIFYSGNNTPGIIGVPSSASRVNPVWSISPCSPADVIHCCGYAFLREVFLVWISSLI